MKAQTPLIRKEETSDGVRRGEERKRVLTCISYHSGAIFNLVSDYEILSTSCEGRKVK